ncbi:HlyD family secretion protein [Nostoc sp.]|uniref:HlyD family secretion protein n=1 Tax=Nostoc sp. TaxID=1180 RepID=UPI002FFAEDEA
MKAEYPNSSDSKQIINSKASQHRLRFQVLPPTKNLPKNDLVPAQPVEEKSVSTTDQSESKHFAYTKWLIFGSLIVTACAISQISVYPEIKAEAWLESAPDARQVVQMEIPGKITKILVKPNQSIQKNDKIALVLSEELDEDIQEWNLRLQERVSALESSKSQISTTEAQLNQARILEESGHFRVEQLQQEIKSIEIGVPTPQNQSRLSQINSLRENIKSFETSISNYEKLAKEGVYPSEKVNEIKRQKLMMEAEVAEIQAQYEATKKQFQDELKSKQDELNSKQDELKRLITSRQVTEAQMKAALATVNSQIPMIEKLQNEVKTRQNRQFQNKVLRAPMSGTVITPNLYQLVGKTMPKGEQILEIADPTQLVAIIEVRQEDGDLVKPGASVTFNPPEPGLAPFTTKIKEISPVMRRDEQMQKSVLRVIAVIDSSSETLKPNAKMYAKISSPHPVSLYENVRREFLNLFKVRSL